MFHDSNIIFYEIWNSYHSSWSVKNHLGHFFLLYFPFFGSSGYFSCSGHSFNRELIDSFILFWYQRLLLCKNLILATTQENHFSSFFVIFVFLQNVEEDGVNSEIKSRFFAERAEPFGVCCLDGQIEEVVQVKALIVFAESSSGWAFQFLGRQGTEQLYLHELTDNFIMTFLKIPINKEFWFIEAGDALVWNFFDQLFWFLFFNDIDCHEVIFGVNSLLFVLFFNFFFNDIQFIILCFQ